VPDPVPPRRQPRGRRSDATRNRDAIVVAAQEVFDADGVMAPLDTVARRAGVGNATLYRHFPTREDLLAVVMAAGLEAALGEARELAVAPDPRAALREWLFRLTWRLRSWNDLPGCVADARSQVETAQGRPGPTSSLTAVTEPLVEATGVLIDRARATREQVASVAAREVFELVTALAWAADTFGDDETAARRRVALGTAGIVPPPVDAIR